MIAPTPSGASVPPLGSPPAVPAGRWMRLALILSLAVNLAIAGLVAGAMFHKGGSMHARMPTRDVGFGPFTEALSKDDRTALRRAFIAASPDLRDGQLARRANVAEVLALLRVSPFDASALQDAFDQQSERTAERLKLGQDLIFDLIVGMSDDARLAFSDRLEQSLSRRAKRRDAP